ncbi:uncharacterized protein [Nicotiana tomentosiformis]|uniref:uncharacterized protein n=1 Tax=Nicotiana tomentosiformis TaxID=4098 RepID=UPI00388CA9F0
MVTDSDLSASECTSSNQTFIVPVAENAFVVPGLTKKQYSQLLSLLHFNSTLLNQSDSLTWIIDSGASDHMIANKEYLINITPLPITFLVSLPNGYKGPSLKKPLDLRKLDIRLYKFVWEKPSQPHVTLSTACNSLSSLSVSDHFPCTVNIVSSSCNKDAMNKMDIVWHHKLAHVPFIKMKSIYEISSNSSSTQSFPCTICPMARQTRLPFPDISIHSSKPFQLVHVDIWGPYHISTYSG